MPIDPRFEYVSHKNQSMVKNLRYYRFDDGQFEKNISHLTRIDFEYRTVKKAGNTQKCSI